MPNPSPFCDHDFGVGEVVGSKAFGDGVVVGFGRNYNNVLVRFADAVRLDRADYLE